MIKVIAKNSSYIWWHQDHSTVLLLFFDLFRLSSGFLIAHSQDPDDFLDVPGLSCPLWHRRVLHDLLQKVLLTKVQV